MTTDSPSQKCYHLHDKLNGVDSNNLYISFAFIYLRALIRGDTLDVLSKFTYNPVALQGGYLWSRVE